MKYKVVKRSASEFGSKSYVFVIAKLVWGLFWWDTNQYFFFEESAQTHCDELNKNLK